MGRIKRRNKQSSTPLGDLIHLFYWMIKQVDKKRKSVCLSTIYGHWA